MLSVLLFLLICAASAGHAPQALAHTGATRALADSVPVTGVAVPSLASFDRQMLELMTTWEIPGGALGVVEDGRLVLARGYGYADKERGEPVQPNSLFRIASVSKPFTAVAILELVEENRLRLDDSVLPLLDNLLPPDDSTPDPRLEDVTVRDLLQHSGGWDRDELYDPMFIPGVASAMLGVPAPDSADTIIRYMKGEPLQFTPGSRYAYSNLGYCILGRIVERVSGQTYADFVRERVLKPAGITSMRLGHTRLGERAPGEVRYYDAPDADLTSSIFPDEEDVPAPYGGFNLEAMDANGGWIASPIDVLRFVNAVDGRNRQPSLLRPETINLMVARPAVATWQDTDYYYALGWNVRPVGTDANWWHAGSLSGTTALVVRAANGLSWFAVFNSRPLDGDALATELDQGLWQAVGKVTEWPAHDLFSLYR